MHWHFDKIPPSETDRILNLYYDHQYQQIAYAFVKWGVIPGGCGSCNIIAYVPGFMEYAIDKKLINTGHGQKTTTQRVERGQRDNTFKD